MQTFNEVPHGYRWLTDAEWNEFFCTDEDDRFGWMNYVAVKCPVSGSNTAGYIVPWDCIIEFGMDHDHDPVECERILADMNPEFGVHEHYDGYGNKEYY